MNNEETNMDLVTVAVENYPYQASILKALLEEAGIKVFLQNEYMAQLYGNTVGGIAVQVSNTDVEKARELLIESGHK
ncbi:MAG: DUF2007 domain-containing protein [Bacteroidales bacterium]|jgi:hypothetical protein|nr:DUF2007 domain-containing protein [Bacteroidales bacterium]